MPERKTGAVRLIAFAGLEPADPRPERLSGHMSDERRTGATDNAARRRAGRRR